MQTESLKETRKWGTGCATDMPVWVLKLKKGYLYYIAGFSV